MANPNWRSKTAKKRTVRQMQDLIEQMQDKFGKIADPAEILLYIAAGIDPRHIGPNHRPGDILPDGYEIHDLETRMEAAKAVINYCRPKLAQMEHVGDENRPITLDTVASQEFSTNPAFRAQAEALVIHAVSQQKLIAVQAIREEEEEDMGGSFINVDGTTRDDG